MLSVTFGALAGGGERPLVAAGARLAGRHARFHHWHHAREAAAVDRNFAVHLPWIDRLFGTAHLPGARWPAAYGVDGPAVPDGWLRQLVLPFRR